MRVEVLKNDAQALEYRMSWSHSRRKGASIDENDPGSKEPLVEAEHERRRSGRRGTLAIETAQVQPLRPQATDLGRHHILIGAFAVPHAGWEEAMTRAAMPS